jgi:hypothetical protein
MSTVYKSTDLCTAYKKYQQADQMISLTRWEGPPIEVKVMRNSGPCTVQLNAKINYEKGTITEAT